MTAKIQLLLNKQAIRVALMVFLLIGMVLSFLHFASPASLQVNAEEMALTLGENIEQMMRYVDERSAKDEYFALSMNPYSCIEDNPYYENIVACGPAAIPLLERYLIKTPYNNLREYMIAIAIEEIAQVNLKDMTIIDGLHWETAKGFCDSWKELLKAVPENVDKIVASDKSEEQKISELEELGLLAIPYIEESTDVQIQNYQSSFVKSYKKDVGNQRIDHQRDTLKRYIDSKNK